MGVALQSEIDRVNLEIQSAERDYDLNRAAELKYGTLLNLQKQLKEAEAVVQAKVRALAPVPTPTHSRLPNQLSGSINIHSCPPPDVRLSTFWMAVGLATGVVFKACQTLS